MKNCNALKLLPVLLTMAVTITMTMSWAAHADVAIIVHPGNTADLSEKAVANIFLGKSRAFSSGDQAIPLSLENDSSFTTEFCEKYLGKTNNQFRSYWARMMFSGAGVAPKTIDSDDEMLKLVANNPNLIGFIDASKVNDSVKVVLKK